MSSLHAIVLFVDIRGFTRWSRSSIEAGTNGGSLLTDFHRIIDDVFAPSFIKTQGDGAIVIKRLRGKRVRMTIVSHLKVILEKIDRLERRFEDLCEEFSLSQGCRTDLKLGWGMVRGLVNRIPGDYMSENINLCARLCGIARPHGIVIERDDFPDMPREYGFIDTETELAGIAEPVKIWISQPIKNTKM